MDSPIVSLSSPVGIGTKKERISSMPIAFQKNFGSFMIQSVDTEILFVTAKTYLFASLFAPLITFGADDEVSDFSHVLDRESNPFAP